MGKMTTGILSILVIILLALNIFQFYYFNYLRPSLLAEGEPMSILDLKGPNWRYYLGRRVTIEGYYFSTRRQVPMLVSSLDLLLVDSPMSKDKFLRLNGTIPDALQQYLGDMVYVTGKAQESSDSEEKIILVFESYKHIQYTWTHQLEAAISVIVTVPPYFLRTKYAVLISGGVDASMAYMRYWNDLKYMYSILRNRYNYAPENIYVIYKNGIGEDSEIPVNKSATVANVQDVFDELAEIMTIKDTLFLFTNNHGSYMADTSGDEPETGTKYDEVLCLWGQNLLDDQLATMLTPLHYSRMIIFMKQCFSGGFIWDLSGTNRIILTACTQNQVAYGADTEGAYGEFSYHFMKAVNLEVAADTNADGKVSMVEAFNYASTHDSQPETPNYDDNADHVGHTALIPNGGDGTLGDTTYL